MSDIRKAIMERLGAVAEGEKATMSKASDALNYIKNSIASGKTVYVSAGHRITKVTPKAYAKWEASGKPLFKLGNDGALLMASGSSYVRLTMGDDMMLAGITAMSRPGAKAAFAIPAKWQSEDRYVDQRAQQADEPNAPSFKQGKYIAYVHYRNRSVQVDNMLRRTPPGQYRNELEAYLASVDQKIAKYKNSRPGEKATFGSKRTTAGALRKQLKAQGMTDPADLEWHGISASDPDSTPYWLHEDGSMEKIKSSRPGAKAAFGTSEDIRRLLGDAERIATSGYSEQDKNDAIALLKQAEQMMDASTPEGARKRVARIKEHLRVRFSNSGAKATFDSSQVAFFLDALSSQVIDQKDLAKKNAQSAADYVFKHGTDAQIKRFVQLAERVGLRVNMSRPGAKATMGRAEDLYRKLSSGSITYANAKEWDRLVTEALRLPDYTPPGGDMSLHEIAEDLGGELMALKTHRGPVPNAKATAAKPDDTEREDVKAGLKVMSAADPAVSDKIRTLIKEGKPQDQAVAIALDMKRRGEI